jgi:hypothetical protein
MRLTLLTLMPYRSASSRCGVPARLSVRLADDLLAQSVDEPPAPASRKRGSGAVVVELDMGDLLGSMRHYVPNIRVRVEAHKLHPCFRRSKTCCAILIVGLVSRVQRTCSRIPTG